MGPIKRLEFTNFRSFSGYSLSCRAANLLVGENNSGKSSILDAVRVTSDVLKFARRRNPDLIQAKNGEVVAGYEMAHNAISIPTENTPYNYSNDDALIRVHHVNGNILDVYLHPDRAVRVQLFAHRGLPRNAGAFRAAFPIDFIPVPVLSPVEETERWVEDETVRRNESTRLSSRNFRNIWLRRGDQDFLEFKRTVEEAWPGITIFPPTAEGLGPTRTVTMMFEEDRVPREIHWAGFGFQVWPQLVTHFLRSAPNSVLVFDEPDTFLHPDLQKRLYRFVTSRFEQCFIATHSTELVNEARPGDILSVRRGSRSARRITSEEGYRKLYGYLGSSENAELARISRANRIVFFEGKDRRLVRRFARLARLGGHLMTLIQSTYRPVVLNNGVG